MKLLCRALIILFPLFFFHGCATKDAIKSISAEEILKQRVHAYWNHKINREFEKAYKYEYVYPLKSMTVTKYIELNANPMITFKSFEIKSISWRLEDVADVELSVIPVAKAPGAKPFEYPVIVTERWVRVDESWYRVGKGIMDNLTQEKKKGGDVKN